MSRSGSLKKKQINDRFAEEQTDLNRMENRAYQTANRDPYKIQSTRLEPQLILVPFVVLLSVPSTLADLRRS